MYKFLMIFSVALILFFTVTDAYCAKKDGWFLRVDPNTTQADAIDLWVGKSGDSLSHHYWRQWTNADDTEIDLPYELNEYDSIWVKGKAIPHGKMVRMFISFRDEIPQEMTFKDEMELNIQRERIDEDEDENESQE